MSREEFMDSQQPNPNPEVERIFDQAVERLSRGEPIDQVINSYPSQHQPDLSVLLDVASLAQQIHHVLLPQRAPAQRTRARANFMQAVAVEARATVPAAIVEPPSLESSQESRTQTVGQRTTPRPRPSPSPSPRPTLWERMQALIAPLVSPTTMRLAPIALALLMLVAITGSGLVVVSRAAIPGDLTYPIKQWLRQQAVILAPDDMRQAVLDRQAEEQALEAEAAAQRQLEEEKPRIIETTLEGIFLGAVSPSKFMAGFMAFENSYLPSLDALERLPMTVKGNLTPGSRIRLWYQIVPNLLLVQDGQTTFILQAKAIEVLAPPPTPTPTPTITPVAQPVEGAAAVVAETPTPNPTPIPTATGLAQAACHIIVPGGWVGYRVQSGDTLSVLAARVGVSMARLSAVNCLPSTQIIAGSLLYVPALPVTATPLPTHTPTDTPTSTSTSTSTSTPSSTPTVEPTIEATAEPTAEVTVTPLPNPTALPTKTPSPVSTATVAPTAAATDVVTVTLTLTPIATVTPAEEQPTATSTSLPPTATATPPTVTTSAPASTPTEAVTPSATPSSPGAETPTIAPTSVPTSVPTATPAALSPTATPTTVPPAAAETATPTTVATTPASAETATLTPTLPPTGALVPTQTPTVVPATDTPIPPTPTPTPMSMPIPATPTPTLTPVPPLAPTPLS